jgi:hypothetical protein
MQVQPKGVYEEVWMQEEGSPNATVDACVMATVATDDW